MDMKVWLLAAVGILLQALFIKVEHDQKYVAADILKGSASLMFVLIGFLAYRLNPSNVFVRRIFIGLILGMIGDILLNLRFVFEKSGQKIFLAGIAAFLTGHILYLLAIIPYATRPVLSAVIGAVIAAALLIYIFKTMDVKPAFKAFGVVYLGAIIIMTCLAINCALDPRHLFIYSSIVTPIGYYLYAIGAVLFTASDIVLIFNTFSGVTKFSLRILNLSLYYAGQLLIAISLFFPR